jgi:hypothetical protein
MLGPSVACSTHIEVYCSGLGCEAWTFPRYARNDKEYGTKNIALRLLVFNCKITTSLNL